MDRRIGLLAGLTALFAMGSAHAQTACPYVPPGGSPTLLPVPIIGDNINPETGHTYDVYRATGISWLDAQRFTACLQQGSPATTAHLATITSSAENNWIVNQLLTPVLGQLEGGRTQVWIGGMQAANATSVGAGWSWVNNEGPFSGVNGVGVYTNWAAGEPNDGDSTFVENGAETHLTLGRFPNSLLYGWNDEGAAPNSIGGFIVEYDTPRTVEDCPVVSGESQCTTVEGQTISFPPGTFTENSSFTFTAYEFTDPRVDNDPASATYKRCIHRYPLEVFKESVFNVPAPPPAPPGTLTSASGMIVIPEYLCGSPKFLIIRAVDNGISVEKGVVTTTNKTLELAPGVPGILPGNFFDCVSPIPAGGSPQQQDVGVWQDLNPENMREYRTNSAYFGSVAELTTGCGSTLLKTSKKSNFLVGLHIDFGPDVPYGKALEYQKMLELTQKKVLLTRDSVTEAIAQKRFVKNPDGQAMLSQLDSVYNALLANNLSNARKKTQDFLAKVKSSEYTVGPTLFNFHGDHQSRGENILFMLNHKLIPFKNSPP